MKLKRKIEKVKNPWVLRDGVMVIDIETNYVTGWSEQEKRDRIFKCGVAFSYADDQYHIFENPEEFVEFIDPAKALVSFNGEGFDFLVLNKHGLKIKKHEDRWRPIAGLSFDILHTIQKERLVKHQRMKYPSLEELMFQHYGIKKVKYDFEDLKQIMKHCHEDVKYTKRLYEEKVWSIPLIKRREGSPKEAYDDIDGYVDDGENLTHIANFGMPFDLKPDAVNEEVIGQCPNCKESLLVSGYGHYGYGAGSGYLSRGRSLCPACKKGCYKWERDDTPGFRDHFKDKCCFCRKRGGE